jgi:hypothetical protein
MWFLLEVVVGVVTACALLAAIVAGMAFVLAPTKFLSGRIRKTGARPKKNAP